MTDSTPAIEIHQPCPDCGSGDAMSVYEDGGTYCFSCQKHTNGTSSSSRPTSKKAKTDMETIQMPSGLEIAPLPDRKITAATAKFWNYRTRGTSQYAVYMDKSGNNIVGLKKRSPDKKFPWLGEYDPEAPLFGQHLWSNQKGKHIVITEGEIDAMSVSQAYANKWPVVSVNGGAAGAARNIKAALKWLDPWDKIIIWFDNDEPGQAAAKEVAEILPPGKAYIVKSTHKDANEVLCKEGSREVTGTILNAELHTPPGLITLDSMIEEDDLDPPGMGIRWSKPFLNKWTYGRRYGEVYTFGAGTGVGKSDFLLEEVAYTVGPEVKESVAIFSFENGPKVTALQVLGKMVGARLHKPDADPELREKAKKFYAEECATIHINDMRGSSDWEEVKATTRFNVHAHDIRHVVLDNLTALADPSRERESLEIVMKEVTALAAELNICIYLVSHLTTPEHGSHEEGARVTIRQFKGSRSIGFWSFFIFGMERDQQSEDEEGGTTTFRCLKDRFTGEGTGKTVELVYDLTTGIYAVAGILDKVFKGPEGEPNADF